ncbi:hypothetical protein [Flavobacterium algicola]|uniref:hypothetical protein n=1 Tax=Flavobacterium algicola TaxID=556529 RepID=UPI001EFC59D9|nr:hypothetical protein [Flavobacterium algicola]MCG9793305.1 hypothetical protein [Flavobacterium algicola]
MTAIVKTIFLLFFFSTTNIFAQSDDLWTAFYNKDSTAVGYRDAKGIVQIQPKFSFTNHATNFRNIIAVVEETQKGKWKSYYLTRSGKIVGKDSLHIFDNGHDCESEGFIRFKDNTNDKVGLFDKNGEVTVPADYNELSRSNNGMIIALKGAIKKQSRDKEHYSWSGGQELLINAHNTILIENFKDNSKLNLYSLKITDSISSDYIRTSFLATDGKFYSFIDFEKEFRQWLKQKLLFNLTAKKLQEACLATVSWQSSDNWMKTKRKSFVTKNYKLLKNNLLKIKKPKTDYFIYAGGLNNFLFNGEAFKKYYNDCGESIDNKYPTMTIVLSQGKSKGFSQNHFEFLRTDAGYKLINVTVSNGTLK